MERCSNSSSEVARPRSNAHHSACFIQQRALRCCPGNQQHGRVLRNQRALHHGSPTAIIRISISSATILGSALFSLPCSRTSVMLLASMRLPLEEVDWSSGRGNRHQVEENTAVFSGNTSRHSRWLVGIHQSDLVVAMADSGTSPQPALRSDGFFDGAVCVPPSGSGTVVVAHRHHTFQSTQHRAWVTCAKHICQILRRRMLSTLDAADGTPSLCGRPPASLVDESVMTVARTRPSTGAVFGCSLTTASSPSPFYGSGDYRFHLNDVSRYPVRLLR